MPKAFSTAKAFSVGKNKSLPEPSPTFLKGISLTSPPCRFHDSPKQVRESQKHVWMHVLLSPLGARSSWNSILLWPKTTAKNANTTLHVPTKSKSASSLSNCHRRTCLLPAMRQWGPDQSWTLQRWANWQGSPGVDWIVSSTSSGRSLRI